MAGMPLAALTVGRTHLIEGQGGTGEPDKQDNIDDSICEVTSRIKVFPKLYMGDAPPRDFRSRVTWCLEGLVCAAGMLGCCFCVG